MRAYLRWAFGPQGGLPMLIIISGGALAYNLVGLLPV